MARAFGLYKLVTGVLFALYRFVLLAEFFYYSINVFYIKFIRNLLSFADVAHNKKLVSHIWRREQGSPFVSVKPTVDFLSIGRLS